MIRWLRTVVAVLTVAEVALLLIFAALGWWTALAAVLIFITLTAAIGGTK